MHDIRAIRDNPALYVSGWSSRGVDGAQALVDDILTLVTALRAAQTAGQTALARRNESSKLIGAAMGMILKRVLPAELLEGGSREAIRLGAGFLSTLAALVIGLFAGILVVLAVKLLDMLRIDDPVGAIPVHLFNGVFGTICVGLFAVDKITGAATGNGLFNGGGATGAAHVHALHRNLFLSADVADEGDRTEGQQHRQRAG